MHKRARRATRSGASFAAIALAVAAALATATLGGCGSGSSSVDEAEARVLAQELKVIPIELRADNQPWSFAASFSPSSSAASVRACSDGSTEFDGWLDSRGANVLIGVVRLIDRAPDPALAAVAVAPLILLLPLVLAADPFDDAWASNREVAIGIDFRWSSANQCVVFVIDTNAAPAGDELDLVFRIRLRSGQSLLLRAPSVKRAAS